MSSFSEQHATSISKTCKLLGITRRVYYYSLLRTKKCKELAQKVVDLVKKVRAQMPRVGTRKLYHILEAPLKALKVGRDKLFFILKANHLLILPKRRYHVTTNSLHRFKKHRNLIANLKIERAEQVWVSDITYVGTRENPMYLALVTDAYSKKIVGYDVSNSLETVGCSNALKMALKNRNYPLRELIHHSDRGVQYCSDEYQTILIKNRVRCSMTECYDPYENAVAERVNGILKQEFLLDSQITYLKFLQKVVKQSVEIYNTERPHWSLYMQTPQQTHQEENIRIRTYKKEKSDNLKTA
ncbi:IS3 family transposase [Bernardetia sp. OM2101]|uniref:IS3 family transposase n=1 Tax=Bernardetia sp. OM2101 TaxID=3344876 RepID=UPI0035D13846